MSKSGAWKAFSVWVVSPLILALAAVLMAPSPAAGAATWYVDGTLGTDNVTQGTGPGINAFKTIQYAINDVGVVDTDTITVAAGTYNEDIQINKGLTIQSSTGATNTIIRGSGGGSSYYMIRIYNRDVTFDGFTVTNPTYQGGADASGILVGDYLGVSANNIHILNNIIKEVRNGTGGTPSNYGAAGINIGRGAPSGIVISGNVIENIHNPNGASNDHTCGINVWDNGNGIEISNNRISDIKYNGILLQYANNVQVTSNTITQCEVGVKADPYTGATVSGVTMNHNVIVENSDYGVDNNDPNLFNAVNNWWGCNDGPGIVGPGNGDNVSGSVTYDPWLVLNLCANPLSILADGISTSTITADMTKNSNGQDTSAQGHIPDGTQITFTTDKGSIGSPTTKPTTNGIATAVFTSDTSPSQATISARAPAWTACATSSTPVNMYQPGGGAILSACDWVEYSNNPVFGQWLGGPKAYYPKVIYDAGQFSGHGDSTYYKMWFGSSTGTGYAYSDNGTSWIAGLNPLPGLVPNANHPLVEYDSSGFGHGVYYKMWYWDPGVSIYSINALRYAESADGINWVNDQSLTQDISYPLVTSNPGPDWNAGSYGPCDLIYNSSSSNSLDDSNLWNNKYVMYYMGTTGGSEFIGLAYSANGTHWKRYGCIPILSPGAAADWDNTSVGYCSVINISGSWQMWYGGGTGTNHGIGYATSPDGISWTKHPGNPIFHKNDGIPWRNDRTYTPWVVYDVANFSGHGDAYPYKMWFSGRSNTGAYYVGYAYALPIIADAGTDQTITSGSSTVIGGSPTASGGTPPYTYSWNPASWLNNPTLANPTASPTTTTTYTVTVTDSKGCTGSDNMTVSVQPPPPPSGGSVGGGGGLPPAYAACPATVTADIQGNITTVRATKDGVLCATCVAEDTSGKYTLQLDEGTKVISADNTVPLILRFQETSERPPTPENTMIVGPVYEINAYSSIPATTPSPVTISPPATVILTYGSEGLPKNTSEVFIANYDTEEGWQPLASVPGVAAEVGKAQGLTNHLSLFAVLATVTEPATAKFEVSNLTVSPSQAQLHQRITISLNVANTGSISGSHSLKLKVDGETNSTKQVTIAPGTSQTVNLILTEDTAGKHRIEVAGLSGEFEVIEAKVIEPSGTNWWLIIGVTAIILLIIAVSIALMR
ncbi:hypothetical protein ACFLTN_05775 [Chloroflexota bacterium]